MPDIASHSHECLLTRMALSTLRPARVTESSPAIDVWWAKYLVLLENMEFLDRLCRGIVVGPSNCWRVIPGQIDLIDDHGCRKASNHNWRTRVAFLADVTGSGSVAALRSPWRDGRGVDRRDAELELGVPGRKRGQGFMSDGP